MNGGASLFLKILGAIAIGTIAGAITGQSIAVLLGLAAGWGFGTFVARRWELEVPDEA